jgi:hypothetical protein
VIKPSGIKDIPLPKSKSQGCSLMSSSDIYECDDALTFNFGATKKGKYLISVFKKEIQLTRVKIKVNNDYDVVPVVLTLPSDVNADGVLRVTVTDDSELPVAERLIFRKQSNRIKVNVSTEYKDYCPGDKVKLNISTKDDNDKPGLILVLII